MRNLLHLVLATTLCMSLHAQKLDFPNQAAPSMSLQNRSVELDESPRAVNCVDTLFYGELKQYAVQGSAGLLYFIGLWQVDQEAITQTFLFNGGTLNLTKVLVPGRLNPMYNTVTNPTVLVEVFNVDAFNVPTTLIGSTSFVMNSTTQNTYVATFSTPLNITGNYAIVVRPQTTGAVVDIVVNDIIQNQPWDEDLCKLKSADPALFSNGQWVAPQTYTASFPDGPCNFDLCIAPIVNYTGNATVSATPTTVCVGNEVQFNAVPTPTGAYSSRMMSFQAMRKHFNVAELDSTYVWNVNTANNNFLWGSTAQTHVYTAAGTYNTRFFAIGGMYHTCLLNTTGPVITVISPAQYEEHVELIASTESVCEGAGNITLTGVPAGGTYSGSHLTSNIFNTTQASPGTYTVTYQKVINACTITKELTLTVKPLPTVTYEAQPSLCFNAAPITLTGGLPVGGTYSGTGVSNGIFTPVIAGLGTHQLTYSFTQDGCTNSAQQALEVSPCLSVDAQLADVTSIYPNPSNGLFSIDVFTNENVQMTLTSADGKVVLQNVDLNYGGNTIQVNGYANGLYFIQLSTSKGQYTHKITLY